MIRLSLRRPVAVAMAYTAVALLGVAAWRNVPIELLPDTRLPRLMVSASWPGASPETVEAFLTAPLASTVQQVRGVERIVSESFEQQGTGTARIDIEFQRDTDMDFARLDLSERVATLEETLPAGVRGVQVSQYVPEEFEEQNQPFLLYTFTGPFTLEALRRHLDDVVATELSALDGVALVRVVGGRQRRLEVQRDDVTNVHRDQRLRVDGDATEAVRGSREVAIGTDDRLRVEGNRSVTTEGDDRRVVEGDVDLRVDGRQQIAVHGSLDHLVEGDTVARHHGNLTTIVGRSDARRAWTTHVEGAIRHSSSGEVEISADEALVLRVGQTSLRLTADTAVLSSPSISLLAGGARLRLGGDCARLQAEDTLQGVANKVLMKSSGAALGLSSEASVDGSRVLLNSPNTANDSIEDEEVQPTIIELTDDDGQPLAGHPYRIVLADGSELSGVLDEDGRAEIEMEGDAEIFFPGLIDVESQ